MHNQWIFYCHLKHCWRHVLCLLCDLGTLRSFRAMAIPVVVGLLKFRHRGTLGGNLAARRFQAFSKKQSISTEYSRLFHKQSHEKMKFQG